MPPCSERVTLIVINVNVKQRTRITIHEAANHWPEWNPSRRGNLGCWRRDHFLANTNRYLSEGAFEMPDGSSPPEYISLQTEPLHILYPGSPRSHARYVPYCLHRPSQFDTHPLPQTVSFRSRHLSSEDRPPPCLLLAHFIPNVA